jgi:ABC-type antimicrobial peptide transport system permease subunit
MILAGTALAGAACFSSAWLSGYRPFDHFDANFSPKGRSTLVISGIVLWAFFCAAWRLLDRYHRRPGWIFFGATATLFLSALLLAIVGALAIAVAIVVLSPDPGWPGLELFPRQIYYLDRIPVFVDSSTLGTIVAITLLVSLVFSIYPALRAAAANPIEAIRDE